MSFPAHATAQEAAFLLRHLPGAPHRTVLTGRGLSWQVTIGARGVAHLPREGDMATPATCLRPVLVFYRSDRVRRPHTLLPVRAIGINDGWCDTPFHPAYNRFVHHPFPVSAERLWREDRAYDLCVVLDFNIWPRAQGRGSAIFLHLKHDDGRPTAGCIAMREADLRRLLQILHPGDAIAVA